ncbi:MAG: DUF3526 domain-containing protein [Bacteroidota bacterium]
MKNILHILKFEWKNLGRSATLKALLLVFFAAGIYGIYFGKFEVEKQTTRMAAVQEYEQQQFAELLKATTLDTTTAENKAKYQLAVSPTGVGWTKHFTYYVTNEAPPLAGLCLGQRDLFPVYYGFNVTDLARQVNVGELANPMKLLTGNFDLSYVFTFLLPLLLIALFYDLYAAEKEGGTLSLLQAQPVSLNTILWSKVLLRLFIVWGVGASLLTLGFLLQGISILDNLALFGQWLTAISAYTLLWAGLMAGIVALKRSSALSAMLGLGVWLIFTLITPALINLTVSNSTPLPNRSEVIHTVRNVNDQNWESAKSFVFDKFYQENPQYNQGDTTNFNKWYYASFTVLDEAANDQKAAFEQQVQKRNALLKKWEWLAPAAMVHEHLSTISDTNRASHLRFVQNMYAFHDKLQQVYYDKVFAEAQFGQQDLEQLQTMLAQ